MWAPWFAEKRQLHLPGPSPVPPRVQRAASRAMIDHRGAEFAQLLARTQEGLRQLFGTREDVIALAGSGTAAMEAAVANLVSPGEPVLVLVGGKFGERWAELATAYGADVRPLPYPWGEGVDPEALRQALARQPEVRVVFATQNESSTAVFNDVPAIATVCRQHGALCVVDAVSSLGGAPMEMDAWGVDAVVAGSQKCLMLPPGLSFIALSPRAWAKAAESRSPRFYFDLRAYRELLPKGETPYTPAVSLYFALDEALAMIQEEGLENTFQRHRLLQQMVRQGVAAMGLELLVAERWASPTVTAVKAPPGVEVSGLRKGLNRRGVIVAGGQGAMRGKIFRIGHMGYTTPLDMIGVLAALEIELQVAGFPVSLGAGVRAAQEVWATWPGASS